ncbi:MAG: phosphate-starvation-inducible PsiE family protein [Gammaproteobacteria bacterium]
MIRLTYASTALKEWSPEELLDLLKECRKNNGAKNITGILLYAKGTFFQVLEGDEATVNSLYSMIEKDKRHKDVTIIEKEKITERAFPYWSMGFDKIDAKEISKMEGLNDFFEHDFTPSGFASHKNIIGPLLSHLRGKLVKQVAAECHEELPTEHEDPFIRFLHLTIRGGVKILALLMVGVILLSIADVAFTIYGKISDPPYFVMTTNDLLETFGAFLVVLIAIEIFINITLYIRSDVIPVKLVVATALMAISRKVIVFDYKHLDPQYVSASALVVVALGITYLLVQKHD